MITSQKHRSSMKQLAHLLLVTAIAVSTATAASVATFAGTGVW